MQQLCLFYGLIQQPFVRQITRPVTADPQSKQVNYNNLRDTRTWCQGISWWWVVCRAQPCLDTYWGHWSSAWHTKYDPSPYSNIHFTATLMQKCLVTLYWTERRSKIYISSVHQLAVVVHDAHFDHWQNIYMTMSIQFLMQRTPELVSWSI